LGEAKSGSRAKERVRRKKKALPGKPNSGLLNEKYGGKKKKTKLTATFQEGNRKLFEKRTGEWGPGQGKTKGELRFGWKENLKRGCTEKEGKNKKGKVRELEPHLKGKCITNVVVCSTWAEGGED